MLLTLATGSLCDRISPNGDGPLSMLDLPDFAMTHLQLRGLNVKASMLAGWSMETLDTLRDRADKAACPCLVLVEDSALPLADIRQKSQDSVFDRVDRLAVAAHRLGCNALAISCEAKDSDENFEAAVTMLKSLMPRVERFELNLLIAPHEGLTNEPERLTELLKRVGGFRVGSLPSFAHAASLGNPVDVLRKLAPYAGAIHASIAGFDKSGKHKGYDLAACVEAIRNVGFSQTLAIDYTGKADPVGNIDKAREQLQSAIDVES